MEITDDILYEISIQIPHIKMDILGLKLGFKYSEISKYKKMNKEGTTSDGAVEMLQDWYQRTGTSEADVRLGRALVKAGLVRLKEEFLVYTTLKEEVSGQTT